MFERALALVGYQFAKFQFRNEFDTVQPMTDFFSGAKNVLIALPVGYEEAIVASNALRAFRSRWLHLHLTVIHNSTRATSLIDFPKCEVVRIDPPEINKFSLPTKSLLQRIITRQYDVALDMNLDFVLHTAYICKASRAKVRVGFAHQASDVFFNVQLNLRRHGSPQSLYEKFASCLAMF
jgi:ADP-heptose:LPS heptosyltransferase